MCDGTRFFHFEKHPGQSNGLRLRRKDGLHVESVFSGGAVDLRNKQLSPRDCLAVGDTIVEVNGHTDALMDRLKDAVGRVELGVKSRLVAVTSASPPQIVAVEVPSEQDHVSMQPPLPWPSVEPNVMDVTEAIAEMPPESWGPANYFESEGPGWWRCILCDCFSDDWHVQSTNHKKKVQYHEWSAGQHQNASSSSVSQEEMPSFVASPSTGIPPPLQPPLALPPTAHCAADASLTVTPSEQDHVSMQPSLPWPSVEPNVMDVTEAIAEIPPESWGPANYFESEGPGWWRCILCDCFSDDWHVQSTNHKKKVQYHEWSAGQHQNASSSNVSQEEMPSFVASPSTGIPPPLPPPPAPQAHCPADVSLTVTPSEHHEQMQAGFAHPLPSWCSPPEDFVLREYCQGVWDWKCRLCDLWAGSDDGHVKGGVHRKALQDRRAKVESMARVQAAATRRRAMLAEEDLLEAREWSPGHRHLLCVRVGPGNVDCGGGRDRSGNHSAHVKVALPAEAFRSWPLQPRAGDQLSRRGGGVQNVRLVGMPAALTDDETCRFLDGFAESAWRDGSSAACNEMACRYHGYVQLILQKFRVDELASRSRVLKSFLGILLQILQDAAHSGRRSAQLLFLREAVRSPLIRNILPSLLEGQGTDIREGRRTAEVLDVDQMLSFAEKVAITFPEELCHVQPLLCTALHVRMAARTQSGVMAEHETVLGLSGVVERLLHVISSAGDALARSSGQWDGVSFRRMPQVPAPLSSDLVDCANIPTARDTYASADEYLDVMFRLLRANCFLSLQRGIRSVIEGRSDSADIRVYRATIVGCGMQTRGVGGIVVTAKCEPHAPSAAAKNIRRGLLVGCLLCLSMAPQAFAEVAWARVLQRDATQCRRGSVEVVLEFPEDLNTQRGFGLLFQLLATAGNPLLAVEAPIFYQAHGPVLRVLQSIDSERLPLRGAVLGGALAVEGSKVLAPHSSALCRRMRRQVRALEGFHVDDVQRRALKSLVAHPLAVVQGPPGTGKTFVGLQATQAFVELSRAGDSSESDGKAMSGWNSDSDAASNCSSASEAGGLPPKGTGPVLVLCFKNHALDEFLAKCERFTKNIVRLGGSCSENMAKYNLHTLATQQPKDRSTGRQLHETIKAREENQDVIIAATAELFHRTSLSRLLLRNASDAQLQSLVDGCGGGHQSHAVVASTITQRDGREDIDAESLQPCVWEWLREARQLRRKEVGSFEQVAPDGETSDEEDPYDRAGHQADLGARWAALPMPSWDGFDASAEASIEALAAASTDDLWALSPHARAVLLQHWLAIEVQGVRKELDKLVEEDEILGNRIAELNRRKSVALLRDADIVGCTIVGAAIRVELLREVGFQTVVVEEAAEILEPLLLAAVPPSAQRLLLIGDHEQLRPLVEEDVLARQHGLDVSLMERLVRQEGFQYVMLASQNRMRAEIVELNFDIYPGLGTNEASVRNHRPPPVLANPNGEGMFFVDTSEYEVGRVIGGHGYQNEGEARLIVEHVIILLNEGTEANKITIICTYAGQRTLLKRLLREVKCDVAAEVRVDTIDKSQGDENEIVLVSLTRGGGRFVDTRNRRCVAVSRARSCLVLYGDVPALRRNAASWRAPLEVLQRRGLVGRELPLECPRHVGVRLGPESERTKPRCTRRCEVILRCDHVCGRPCHFACPPCNLPLQDTFPCGHEVERPCGTPLADMVCQQKVAFDRPCGHSSIRRCHAVEGPCREQVSIKCDDCGRDIVVDCAVAKEQPHDYNCPHPCVRSMRCGHPCTLQCGEKCDHGLESCTVCAVEADKSAADRRQEIQAQIQALQAEDYFSLAEASQVDFADVVCLTRGFFAGIGVLPRIQSVSIVRNAKLKRCFLLASQRCNRPQEATMRVLAAASEGEAYNFASNGLIARLSSGGIELSQSADRVWLDTSSTSVGERWVVVCSVQLGREYDCSHPGRCAKKKPIDGFDCTYDGETQCHRVFDAAQILPRYVVRASLEPVLGCLPPPHWSKGSMLSQGWRCVRLDEHEELFKAFKRCLSTDPRELGVGRDVVEVGRYTRLELVRAWRIENHRLWFPYLAERSSIEAEIRERRIKLDSPNVREVFRKPLEEILPDPLVSAVNEERLLHGTSPGCALALLSNGPNERFSGGLFGDGTYLAEDAAKNDQYVTCDKGFGQEKELHRRLYSGSENHPGKVYYLFVCRVVLGCFAVTKDGKHFADDSRQKVFATENRRELACIRGLGSPPVHYHSLLAETGDRIMRFREFIQFHNNRIYPEYMLAYQRK